MDNKSLILLDNSFREQYCYFAEVPHDDVYRKWNVVLDSIESKLPGFSNDYQFIDLPLCTFESLGLRRLVNEEEIKKCFSLIPIVHLEELGAEEIISSFDAQFCSTFEKLINYYSNSLYINKIISALNEKIQKKLHSNVVELKNNLAKCREDLINNTREGCFFPQLCRDLAWDTLVKQEKWIDPSMSFKFQAMTNGAKIKIDETVIIERLIAYYLNNIKENDYLAGSVLFVKYANHLSARSSKNHSKANNPYKLQERVDPYLTEYACTGFYDDQSRKRKSVIVITGDEDQKGRVQRYLCAKKKIYETIEAIGLSHPFVPGYIIIIDPAKHEVRGDIINVADYYLKY